MWNRWSLAALVVVTGLVLWMWPSHPGGAPSPRSGADPVPKRIVTMAPSITEVFFAIGLGDRVVGVTRFCRFPAEVRNKTEVGGYHDPSYEAILGLEPDLVALLPSQRESREELERLGLAVLTIDHRSVESILDSIAKVGDRCGVVGRGVALRDDLSAELDAIAHRTRDRPRPRVLLVVGRDYQEKKLSEIFVAGTEGFYADLLAIAGGTNAYRGAAIRYPAVSREGILRLDPDVIVDLIPDPEAVGLTEAAAASPWMELTGVRAVDTDRVYVLAGDHVSIPGPRILRTARELAACLHPDSASIPNSTAEAPAGSSEP